MYANFIRPSFYLTSSETKTTLDAISNNKMSIIQLTLTCDCSQSAFANNAVKYEQLNN